MEHSKRHVFLYKLLRFLVSPFFKLAMDFRCETVKSNGRPALVLCNHTNDADPILVAIACPGQMYFVASEHAFRWGFASTLIRFAFAPIVRLKGGSGAGTTKDILRALRGGHNVCIFPEGNRTYTGQTLPFVASTGKLAKASGCDLVTYHIEGGYFSWPRWAKTRRRGRMRGRVAGHYTPEQLAGMSADEVNDTIARDLFEDAYARQRQNPVPYRGRRLAEFLEVVLYLCPGCGRFGTLHTQNDAFSCGCGLAGRYTEYGFLEGENLPFDSIDNWNNWQLEQLRQLAAQAGQAPLFGDEEQHLCVIEPCVSSTVIETGTLCMSRHALSLGAHTFPLSEISDLAISGKMALTFSARGTYFEIKSERPRNALKYQHLYQISKGEKE